MSIPEGWRLVPIFPTREMLEAGRHDVDSRAYISPFAMYRAMLAAAPPPPDAGREVTYEMVEAALQALDADALARALEAAFSVRPWAHQSAEERAAYVEFHRLRIEQEKAQKPQAGSRKAGNIGAGRPASRDPRRP